MLRAYQRMPEPRYVLSFGACSNSGGPYWDSYCVTKGVDQFIPVDVYVPGCPPRPEALLHGLDVLACGGPPLGTWRPGPSTTGGLTPGGDPPAAAGPGRGRSGRRDRRVREVSQGTVTVIVPPAGWLAALAFARDELGCDFFDWLSAVDELDAGLAVVAHVYSLAGRHHLLLRTLVARGSPALPTATGIYRGAAWHERETHEMFGVVFTGHPGLAPLLLPDGFEGHPLRKDFVLAARAGQGLAGREGAR